MQNKARRRRVPAFGEWNYYYYSGELATPTVASEPHWHAAAAAPELEASSDVWFKYSPPPRKPPPRPSATGRKKKARRPEKMDRPYGGKQQAARASSSDGAAPSSVERTPASKGNVAAAGKAAGGVRRVVRAVDADLYQVPPPEFVPDDYDDEPRRWHREQRKRKKKPSRSRWMGCFGFNCVPAE
ncbi:unnamed protein product [Urochloa decumbens]|uniref:Uncharacterized protein n=1 Tax=Urochloa decumbens TaxID=240449 RepID=A0ABC9GGZ1_9POAL